MLSHRYSRTIYYIDVEGADALISSAAEHHSVKMAGTSSGEHCQDCVQAGSLGSQPATRQGDYRIEKSVARRTT